MMWIIYAPVLVSNGGTMLGDISKLTNSLRPMRAFPNAYCSLADIKRFTDLWFQDPDSETYAIQPINLIKPGQYVVGRGSHCDIQIRNDPRVSKTHASFIVEPQINRPTTLSIMDLGSRFGVYVDNQKCMPHSGWKLEGGETVRFGSLQDHTEHQLTFPAAFIIRHMSMRVHITGFAEYSSNILSSHWRGVGAEIDLQFSSSCTHLVTRSGWFTLKNILAIIWGIHIVTDEYVYLLEKLQSIEDSIPDPSNYVPLDKNGQNSLAVATQIKIDRTQLFKDFTFVLIRGSPFLLDLDNLLQASGTKLFIIEPSSCNDPNVLMLPNSKYENTIWIHPTDPDPAIEQHVTTYIELLENLGVQWTTYHHVVMAILHASYSFIRAGFLKQNP